MQDASLPEPPPEALAASARLADLIAAEIAARGGWIDFARYMALALYAPGLGYYAGGAQKFGAGGDFVTAPELTPLFARALARQVAQVLAGSAPEVIEAGAGSGQLAADLLVALDALGAAPERYRILEVSGELRARQGETIAAQAPRLVDRVEWLNELPERFSGCLVGNEVLDAMPVHLVEWREDGGLDEIGVGVDAGRLVEAARPAQGAVREAALGLGAVAPGRGEIGLAARAWVSELARRLGRGALLLIDYGLPRRELYFGTRSAGTLRCHYRHRLHGDALWQPGLCDITAHVDFTAIAEAGYDAGLDVAGYANQASFLLNCGIGELLQAAGEGSAALRARGAANVLISPEEMGELFKVIALCRGLPGPLVGFARGDRVHAL